MLIKTALFTIEPCRFSFFLGSRATTFSTHFASCPFHILNIYPNAYEVKLGKNVVYPQLCGNKFSKISFNTIFFSINNYLGALVVYFCVGWLLGNSFFIPSGYTPLSTSTRKIYIVVFFYWYHCSQFFLKGDSNCFNSLNASLAGFSNKSLLFSFIIYSAKSRPLFRVFL